MPSKHKLLITLLVILIPPALVLAQAHAGLGHHQRAAGYWEDVGDVRQALSSQPLRGGETS